MRAHAHVCALPGAQGAAIYHGGAGHAGLATNQPSSDSLIGYIQKTKTPNGQSLIHSTAVESTMSCQELQWETWMGKNRENIVELRK